MILSQVQIAANNILKGMDELKRGFHLVAAARFFTDEFNNTIKQGRKLRKGAICQWLVEDEGEPAPARGDREDEARVRVILRGKFYDVRQCWGVPPFLNLIRG
jgi:hypothetical protein